MSGTGGFQTQVGSASAPAVAGDFASANPWFSFDAGPGGLVAGAGGVTIGGFAWVYAPADPDGTGKIVQSYGTGAPDGFVHRAQQGLITDYLAFAGTLIKPGYQMGLMTGGDFWVKNNGSGSAQRGNKAWASARDGSVAFAATGAANAPGGASVTGTIASQSTTFNGAIVGDVLTVTTLVSGTIGVGSILTGGTGLVTNTRIVSQLSGTIGGVGTYAVNFPNQSVASTLLTGTYGLLTVSAVGSGNLELGDVLASGTAVTTGSFITALGTGTGLTGTYLVTPAQNSTPGLTVTVTDYFETNWFASGAAIAGDLVKITDHP